MGIVISVYTREAFKEYVVSSVNNADYSIVLNKQYFQMREDISLDFEVINGVWKIKCSKSYRIYVDKKEIQEKTVLNDEQMLQIVTNDRKQMYLMVRVQDTIFHAYEKYDVSRVGRITIGQGEQNIIGYDYHHLISKEHAEIIRKGRELAISSRGQNGLYVNAKYITGTEPLHFGDFINIYGLHMVFLGNILAVDIENPNVSVNEKALHVLSEQEEEQHAGEETEWETA